jgi:hypothetical protein
VRHGGVSEIHRPPSLGGEKSTFEFLPFASSWPLVRFCLSYTDYASLAHVLDLTMSLKRACRRGRPPPCELLPADSLILSSASWRWVALNVVRFGGQAYYKLAQA